MAGIVVPFLPKTEYNFSFLANSASSSIVIHRGLSVTGYYYARMMIRVHAITMVSAQSLVIAAYGTSPSSDDPREFTVSSSTLSVTISNSHSAGSLVDDTDTDIYPFLKMLVTGSQGGATGGQSLYAVLSGDLLLREA